MKFVKCKDYDEMSRRAAELIASQVLLNRSVFLDWQQVLHRLGLIKGHEIDLILALYAQSILTNRKGLSGKITATAYLLEYKFILDDVNIDKANTNVPANGSPSR